MGLFMNIDLLDIIKDIINAQGIQILLLSAPYTNTSDIDYQFRERLYKDFNYSIFINYIQHMSLKNKICNFTDDFHLNYIVSQFSEALRAEYPYEYCLIGPFLYQPMHAKAFFQIMEKKSISVDLYKEAQEFFNKIPIVSSYDTFHAQMGVILTRLLGSNTTYCYAENPICSFLPDYSDYKIQATPNMAQISIEERYQAESNFLKAVSAGNIQLAISWYHIFCQYKLVPRVADPLRNAKNLTITLNTLLRKAVQAGHVHPLHIDNLSTQFAIQIENATSEHQITMLSTTMIRKYCFLVKNYSRIGYSSLVQSCLDYIDFHYTENLSLDSMAKMCSVSNSYLSSLFKREVHMTLTDYINSTRIRQSLILLNTTALPIQDIAIQCGFTDTNYFTRIFKKFQGKSPRSYRNSIKNQIL